MLQPLLWILLLLMNNSAHAEHLKKQIRLTREDLTIGLTPRLGGRLMELQFKGTELFYQDDQGIANATIPHPNAPLCDLFLAKDAMPYPTYGGDKTSVGPQDAWYAHKPPLDLDAGPYTERRLGSHAYELTSPPDRETGIEITRYFRLMPFNMLMVRDCAKNVSSETRQWGLWNISQLMRPTEVYVRSSSHKEAGNFRPYDFMDSLALFPSRVSEHESYLKIDTTTPGGFKCGGIAQPLPQPHLSEVISVQNTGARSILWHRLFVTDVQAPYAHESSVEIFNFPTDEKPYVEVEVHGPYLQLAPQQSSCLTQLWSFQEIAPGSSFTEILQRVRANDRHTLHLMN